MMTHYKLDKIMEERKVSLNQLVKKTGLSDETIRKVKNKPFANAEIRTLRIIAEALGCNVKDLIDDNAWSYFEKTHEDKDLVNYLSDYQKYFDEIGRDTSELQSRGHLVCRLLLEKKKQTHIKSVVR